MKAAVMYKNGELPQFANVPEPTIKQDDELLVTVKAVAIKHYDKTRAAGKHYSNESKAEATIIGGDGVFQMEDGTRIYGIGMGGTIAEKAVIHKDRIVKIPDALDDLTAAALPNAIIGAAMGLRFKANIQAGDVVLINGATGFTGRVAVQLAKYYGAKKVIATGRNEKSLSDLCGLGADQVISLLQWDEELANQLHLAHKETPFNVIIDYLWGHSAEIILNSLKGNGSFTAKTRFVSIGSLAGDVIQLSAENLRSVDLQLSGSGLGAWSKLEVHQLITTILPEMLELAAQGKLKVDTVPVKLENIHDAWDSEVPDGKRLVIVI
jgi:NADPH:quinone reductase-like Zn-dependent oxidoreductase